MAAFPLQGLSKLHGHLHHLLAPGHRQFDEIVTEVAQLDADKAIAQEGQGPSARGGLPGAAGAGHKEKHP